MAGSISFFIISLLGMSALLFSNGYFKWKTDFFKRTDKMMMSWISQGKSLLLFINKRTLGLLAHYLLDHIELFSNKVFRKLKSIVKKN